jgi:hypothetical protein
MKMRYFGRTGTKKSVSGWYCESVKELDSEPQKHTKMSPPIWDEHVREIPSKARFMYLL